MKKNPDFFLDLIKYARDTSMPTESVTNQDALFLRALQDEDLAEKEEAFSKLESLERKRYVLAQTKNKRFLKKTALGKDETLARGAMWKLGANDEEMISIAASAQDEGVRRTALTRIVQSERILDVYKKTEDEQIKEACVEVLKKRKKNPKWIRNMLREIGEEKAFQEGPTEEEEEQISLQNKRNEQKRERERMLKSSRTAELLVAARNPKTSKEESVEAVREIARRRDDTALYDIIVEIKANEEARALAVEEISLASREFYKAQTILLEQINQFRRLEESGFKKSNFNEEAQRRILMKMQERQRAWSAMWERKN